MPNRFLLLSALLILPAAAHADVRYEMQMKDVRHGDSMNSEVLIKDGMMRFGMPADGQDGAGDMIYRPQDKEILIIDHESNEVRRVTQADMDGMQSMMAASMARMKDALKNMPPEARAQAEAAMGKMTGGLSGASTPEAEKTVRSMGASDTVAGIDCDMYQILEDGVKTQEICAADLDDVTGGEEMMASMKSLADLTTGFLKTVGAQAPMPAFDPVEGRFPILTRQFEDGSLAYESRFVSIEETSLSADQFEAPEGYRARKFME